jgi:hypothetical protein
MVVSSDSLIVLWSYCSNYPTMRLYDYKTTLKGGDLNAAG